MVAREGKAEYCAIFADIIGSRKIPERAELQQRLANCIQDVNARHARDMMAPFRFVAGDDIRGLLLDRRASYAVAKEIQAGIRPHRMRFAVGIGEISTNSSADIAQLDGPALHRASEAMELLKSRKRSRGRSICYASADSDWDRMINGIAFMVSSITSRWSDGVWKRVELLSAGMTLTQAGEQLGISHQSVRDSVVRAGYYAAIEGEELILALLSQLQSPGVATTSCSISALQLKIAGQRTCNAGHVANTDSGESGL